MNAAHRHTEQAADITERKGAVGRRGWGWLSVAKRVRKVEGGFDVWAGSAAGERVVTYLLKFRPLCLIHNICSPFPLFSPNFAPSRVHAQ